jgi:glutamate--cysteine ligase
MSRDQKQDVSLLQDREQLLDYFRAGIKSADRLTIGTEHEKFLWHRANGRLFNFDEIEGLLHKLGDRFGYEKAWDGDRLVALERNDEAITLEPSGQFELSGGLKKTIFETEVELERHFEELNAVGGPEMGMALLGINPYDDISDLGWVPKSRYKIMREYLPTRGDLAHWMMKLTCTIQANMDFTSEEDASDLVRTGYVVSPFVHALFANSSVHHGKPSGYQSYRGHIWTRTDPDRSGVPDFVLRDDWGFGEYLDYVLDVPMFFIRRDHGYVNLAGRSFREFMEKGLDGYQATMGDFELHLSTAFPEVRMKRYVEVRSGDGGSLSHMLALPALWKGVLYDAEARRESWERLSWLDHGNLLSLNLEASKNGIHGVAPNGESIMDICRDLVRISSEGLARLAKRDGHDSEAIFLQPLQTILETRKSAADCVAEDVERLSRIELLSKYSL